MMKLCFLMYQQARGLKGVNNAEQEHTEAVLPRVGMRSLRISVFSSSLSKLSELDMHIARRRN